MTAFVIKLNRKTLSRRGRDRAFETAVPRPNAKEGTPAPAPGDLVLLWVNGEGLIGEGLVAATTGPGHLLVEEFCDYPRPHLGDEWLQGAARDGQTVRSRLLVARTERGGTRRVTEVDLRDLDAARRSVQLRG